MLFSNGITSVRFTFSTVHLIFDLIVAASADITIRSCMPPNASESELTVQMDSVIFGLTLSLISQVIESVGMLNGCSLSSPLQSVFSLLCHAGADIMLALVVGESTSCSTYAWTQILSILPACTELMIIFKVLYYERWFKVINVIIRRLDIIISATVGVLGNYF